MTPDIKLKPATYVLTATIYNNISNFTTLYSIWDYFNQIKAIIPGYDSQTFR